MKSPSAPRPDVRAPDEARVRRLRRALLAHYDATRRELPWRGETDPYRIWVSEVMLQQTRVETVIPFYKRWLEQFPDVDALATAGLDDVLLAWQGLGYYRRARGLHAGAAVVREAHGGQVPRTLEGLRSLPGVGEYTAGAVASIAYGVVTPAVDGNVKRVFARLFDEPSPSAAWLREVGSTLVDPERPGDWNQALMDLGATVCTPRSPRCDVCPLASWCGARAEGTQEERPRRRGAKAVPARALAVAVVADGEGNGWVVRRDESGLLGGMWAFPDVEMTQVVDASGGEEAIQAAREAAAAGGATLQADGGRALETVRHRFTHIDATYHPVVLRGSAPEGRHSRWVPLGGPWPVALPVAQQKIARAASAALGDS